MYNRKKIIGDVFFSIISTATPLIILQLVILPLIASRTSVEIYGMAITGISIVTVVATTFGTALNNIRLLREKDYRKEAFCAISTFYL